MNQLMHFSHNHGLGFHQAPQDAKIRCSGCKSPPSSGNFYVCWKCNYFLHEQCFRASRSFKHPSHPLHPLTLLPCPTYPAGFFSCDSCTLFGDGFSYTCSVCEFDLHVHCALSPPNPMPRVSPSPNFSAQNPNSRPPPLQPSVSHQISDQSETINHFSHRHALKPVQLGEKKGKACSACEWGLEVASDCTVYCCTESSCNFILDKPCFDSPREIRHRSHPQHPMTLLSAPPNGRQFDCFACYRSGKSYVYTCPTCSYNLHIDCVDWRETMTRPDHRHPMRLYFSTAEVSGRSLTCVVCEQGFNEKAWLYYCGECGFGIHTSCMANEMKLHVPWNSKSLC